MIPLRFAQLFAQPIEHARFRDPHRPGAHTQLVANVGRAVPLDGGQPESPPGMGFKFGLDEAKRAIHKRAIRVLVSLVIVLIGSIGR
jgi:hypothetical protein